MKPKATNARTEVIFYQGLSSRLGSKRRHPADKVLGFASFTISLSHAFLKAFRDSNGSSGFSYHINAIKLSRS